MKLSCTLVLLGITLFESKVFAQGTCVDTDGNGWGWNGITSCLIEQQTSNAPSPQVVSNLPCIDTDGNGWGWNGVTSCLIEQQDANSSSPQVNSNLPCIDNDGDGWGWNGVSSCKIDYNPLAEIEATNSNDATPLYDTHLSNNCSQLNSENITSHVTDVVLTAGQSNATGFNTLYEPEKFDEDKISPRLIAWTENYGWQVADPQTQLWDAENWVPNARRGSVAYNHPAFQIGKSILSNDPCRVVAIIATSASNKPISHWLNNVNNHFDVVNNKVEAALQALPNKSKIDMMWWMQGESNNRDSIDEYSSNLNSLISEFRNLSWFGSNKYFLANETRVAKNANKSIRTLRSNGDLNTDYSAGEDNCNLCTSFPHIVYANNPDDIVHFNEIAFRKIGKLVASKYLSDYANRQ